jgi:alpha-methylacyl-CoA racemase
LGALFTKTFKSKTRTEWEAVFDGTDACCLPVLEYEELETNAEREGDQRPAVTLQDTPCLAVVENAGPNQGQGRGVSGQGYTGVPLAPGEGGEKVLQRWLGWGRGEDYEVQNGGVAVKPKL